MNILQRVGSYIQYQTKAQSHLRIHSPFVYQLVSQVFYTDDVHTPHVDLIEKRRNALQNDNSILEVTDLGAGAWKTSKRMVRDIAKNSLKRKKYAQLIHRITHYFQPKTVLELGTSLGITTSYIGQGFPDAKVVTIEGCPQIAGVARKSFQISNTKNIDSYIGNFDEVLPKILPQYQPWDIIFIDGNHAYSPTIRYFQQCLEYAHNDTLFIFDDIHWSPEMEKAWKEIQAHPSVTTTIDIYEMGLVFIRRENKEKEHFVIRY